MAEQETFKLNISRVDGPLFSGEAFSLTVPGVEGEMTILAHHAALISPLIKGNIIVRSKEGENTHAIEMGTIEISNNSVSIII